VKSDFFVSRNPCTFSSEQMDVLLGLPSVYQDFLAHVGRITRPTLRDVVCCLTKSYILRLPKILPKYNMWRLFLWLVLCLFFRPGFHHRLESFIVWIADTTRNIIQI